PQRGEFVGNPTWLFRGSRMWQFGADFSPSGDWIATSTDHPQEDIYIVHPDGSGLRQLTNDRAFDRGPRWSPDGRRIAFQSTRGGGWDIWTVNADGGGLMQLTKGETAHNPRWSPDGSRLSYWNLARGASYLIDPSRRWEDQKPEPIDRGNLRGW